MNRNLRDKIDKILDEVLDRFTPPGELSISYKEEWKKYFRTKIMEAVKETLEDEIKSMAN